VNEAEIVLLIAAAVNVVSLGFILWIRRERRRLEAMRYGIKGSAFSEAKRDVATSRLRR
jgi:hypothetical protein